MYELNNKVIALVGRPNVGKSTLFNRLVGRRQAIVDDTPGMTVDRHYGKAKFYDFEYTIIDTGGILYDSDDELMGSVREQTQLAIDEADIIFVLFDGRDGLLPDDETIVSDLRKTEKPVYYLANKIDGPRHADNANDFYALGIDNLHIVSAEHGVNIGDLLVEVEQDYPSIPIDETIDENECRIAVIGRPNVGKSTLVNRMSGTDRHLVTDIPGTTRDAIDSVITRGEKTYRLIDTAGIRRKKKIKLVLEKRTIVKSLKAMDRANVALIMLDAQQGVSEQDTKIAGFAHDKGLASMVVVNKWDLIKKDTDTAGEMAKKIRDRLKFIPYADIIFISAKTGQRADKIFKMIDKAHQEHNRRISTGELNRWLDRAMSMNRPSTHKGKTLKIFYIAQVDSAPPTFMLSVNYAERLHFSYRRYLVNQLREEFGFDGTPIKLFCRKRGKNEETAEDLKSQVLKHRAKKTRGMKSRKR